MKKSIFKKLGGLFLGLAMGLGVAVGVTAGNKASEVKAAETTGTHTLTITRNSFSGKGGYAWYSWTQKTDGGTSISGSGELYTTETGSMQFNKGKGNKVAALFNTTAIPGKITKIEAKTASGTSRTWNAYVSSTAYSASGGTLTAGSNSTKICTSAVSIGTSLTQIGTSTAGYSYFCVQENVSSASYIESFVITYNIEPQGFAVTYNSNGATSGSVPTDDGSYISGTLVTVKGNTGYLEKTGHTFGGWNTNASGTGTNYSAGDTFSISANKTLYAKWTANTYDVTYMVDEALYTSGSYTYGTGLATLASAPTKTGYNFDGWYNGKTKVTAISSTQTGAITLEASYSLINYKINYELNGGTNNENNPATYTIEDAVTFASPTKDGHQFKGWFPDTNFIDTEKIESIEPGSTGDVTVYAKFEAVAGPYIKSISDITGKIDSIERTQSVVLGASLEVGGEGTIDTDINWSVSPTDAGSFSVTKTANEGTTTFTAANELLDNVTITATSAADENISTSFTFNIVNPADEKITSVAFNIGDGADLTYYADDVNLKLIGINLDVIYTSVTRTGFTRSETIAATTNNVMLDLANNRLITKDSYFTNVTTQATQQITVTPVTVTSLQIVGTPKTKYVITETTTPTFEKASIKAIYSSGKEKDVTNEASFTGYNMTKALDQTVTVSFGGKSTSYDISVWRLTGSSEEKEATFDASAVDWATRTDQYTYQKDGVTFTAASKGTYYVYSSSTPYDRWQIPSGTSNNMNITVPEGHYIKSVVFSKCYGDLPTSVAGFSITTSGSATGSAFGELTATATQNTNPTSITLYNGGTTNLGFTKIKVNYVLDTLEEFQDTDNLQEGDLLISASPATVYEGKTSTISFSYPSEVKENVELINGADKVTVTEGTAQEGKKVYNYTFTAPEVAEDTQYTFTAKGVKSGEENSVVVTVKNHVANKVTISLNKNSSTGQDYPTAFYMNSGTTVGSQGVIHSKYFNVQFFDTLDDNYKMFDSLENGKGYKLYAYHLDQSGSEETTPVIMDASTNVYSSGALASQNKFTFGTYHVYATTTDGLVKSTEYVTITYSDNEYIAEGVKFSEGKEPLETVCAYKDSISTVFNNARVDWPLIIGSKYGYISEDFSNIEIKKDGQVISPTKNTILLNEDAGEYTYTIWRTPADKIGTEEGSHHDIYITGSFEVIALDSIEASDAGTGDYPYESGSFSMSASIYCMWEDATDATITASDDMYAYFTVAPESYTPSTSAEAPYTQTINVSLTDDPSICDSYNVSSYKITSNELVLTNVQTRFKIGEAFNSNNLRIEIKYDSNHETKTVTSGFTVDSSAFDNTKLGFYTIKVTYGSYKYEYQVRVSFIGADGKTIDVGNTSLENKTYQMDAGSFGQYNTSATEKTIDGYSLYILNVGSFDKNTTIQFKKRDCEMYSKDKIDGFTSLVLNYSKGYTLDVTFGTMDQDGNITWNSSKSAPSINGNSYTFIPTNGENVFKITEPNSATCNLNSITINYKSGDSFDYSPEQQANIMKTFLSEFKTCESGWNSRKDVEYLVEEYNAMIDDSKKKFDELTMSDYDWHDVETYNVTTHEYGEGSAKVDGILAIDKLKDMVDYYNKSKVSGEATLTLKTSTGDFTIGSNRINPILALNEVDNSVWVISAVALVGLTAIGGYFFYRKRKEI